VPEHGRGRGVADRVALDQRLAVERQGVQRQVMQDAVGHQVDDVAGSGPLRQRGQQRGEAVPLPRPGRAEILHQHADTAGLAEDGAGKAAQRIMIQ
jgi:hypothetical protein